MNCELLFLRANDPIHIGTGGYSLGRVDNSILREPATNIPKIPGTALSGASRHYAAAIYSKAVDGSELCAGQGPHCGKCPICYAFGYSRADTDNYAGTVNVFDAQIILFPTRSIYGTVWVTTERLLKEGRVKIPSRATVPYTANNDWKDKPITLGWRLIHKLKFGALTFSPAISGIVSNRVIVVDEGEFGLVVNGNLEVRTSVAIDPKTGTAKDKALFTYEAIPRNTIFMMEVLEDDYRRGGGFPVVDGLCWNRPLDVLFCGLRDIAHRGVGGMGTRGFGRLALLDDNSVSETRSDDDDQRDDQREETSHVMSENLDYLAAKYSQKLVKDAIEEGVDAQKLENAVTKMLGILQSNGVYGFFLFTRSKRESSEEQADAAALGLLGEVFSIAEAIESLENLSEKFCREPYINHLAQTVLERYLIYARYHAKAEKA